MACFHRIMQLSFVIGLVDNCNDNLGVLGVLIVCSCMQLEVRFQNIRVVS